MTRDVGLFEEPWAKFMLVVLVKQLAKNVYLTDSIRIKLFEQAWTSSNRFNQVQSYRCLLTQAIRWPNVFGLTLKYPGFPSLPYIGFQNDSSDLREWGHLGHLRSSWNQNHFENRPKHFIFFGVPSWTRHPGPHIARHLNLPRNSIGLLHGLSYRGKPGGHFPSKQTIGGMGTSPHRCWPRPAGSSPRIGSGKSTVCFKICC